MRTAVIVIALLALVSAGCTSGRPAPRPTVSRPAVPSARPTTSASRTAAPLTTPGLICRRLETDSEHDVVGELAGELGDAARARRLVDSARRAYCPRS